MDTILRKLLAPALLASVLCSAAPPLSAPSPQQPAPETLDAADLLDAMQAGIGDPEQIAKFKNRLFKGTASYKSFPEQASFREAMDAEGRVHTVTEFSRVGAFHQGTFGPEEPENAGLIWGTNPKTGAKLYEGEDAGPLQRQFGMLRQDPWRSMYAEATYAGTETLGSVECHKIVCTPHPLKTAYAGSEPLTPDTWYIDSATLMPQRVTMMVPAPTGPPAEVWWTFLDWKEVDGVRYAHERRVRAGRIVLAYKYTSIEHDVELPADEFDIPAEVRALQAEREAELGD